MLPSIEDMGAKLGAGMWAMDFQPRHLAKWLLTKWHCVRLFYEYILLKAYLITLCLFFFDVCKLSAFTDFVTINSKTFYKGQ